jgi:hypothetical protein
MNLRFFANMKANLLEVRPCYSFLQETIANKQTQPSCTLNFGMSVILKKPSHPGHGGNSIKKPYYLVRLVEIHRTMSKGCVQCQEPLVNYQ